MNANVMQIIIAMEYAFTLERVHGVAHADAIVRALNMFGCVPSEHDPITAAAYAGRLFPHAHERAVS